jgi:hypothetical protein
MESFFKGHMVSRRGDERSFGDQGNQERRWQKDFSDYMNGPQGWEKR